MPANSSAHADTRHEPTPRPASALDITGVAAIGVAAWRDSYVWPVSDTEYALVSDAVWDAYLDIVEELDGLGQDAVKADHGLPGFLLQHIHLATAAERLQQPGGHLPYGRHVAAHLRPDWAALGKAFATVEPRSSQLAFGARALAKNWILNAEAPLSSRLSACLGHADTWALGSRSPMRAAYQAQNGIACRFVGAEDFVPVSGVALAADLKRAVRSGLDKMNAAAFRILGTSFDVDAAEGAWLTRLHDLAALMRSVERFDRWPKRLLVTNLGQPNYRALALAMRRHGAEVVGFHHGNDLGAQPFPVSNIVDFLTIDRFVVPSSACLKWRRNEYFQSRVSQSHPVRFERVALPLYKKWRAAGRAEPLPERVEKVMLVGYPPNWIRYPYLAAHWSLSHLQAEVTLVERLSSAGFRVLYKAHPEFEQETRELFKQVPCEFVGGHIEDCWRLADAFVFPRISSTSFGFATTTNRMIALFDVKGQEWVKDAYDLLARRCHMVPTTIGDGLRIHVDHDTLIAALRGPVSPPDESYAEVMCA